MADVDLDFGNRDVLLSLLDHTPAIIDHNTKHNSGVYPTEIPKDIHGWSAIDYSKAEELGYFKIDFLNNHVYDKIKSPEHLEELLLKPIDWNKLYDSKIVKQLVHIGNYYDLITRLPKIDSIEKLSMLLAIIRPGKKHLQGKTWEEVEKTVWIREGTDGYSFKKSHAIAFSILISIQLAAIISEQQ